MARPLRAALLALGFALGLVVLDQLVGRALESVLERSPSGQSGDIQRALEVRQSVDVFVFGSSRARRHIDPAVIQAQTGQRAHNAGAHGQTLAYARMLEALLLARGTGARTFALQVDLGHLFIDTSPRAAIFSPYYGESPVVDAILEQTGAYRRVKLLSRAYRFNSLAVPLLAQWAGSPHDPQLGFEPQLGSMSHERIASIPAPWVPPAAPGGGYAPLPKMERWLREFVRDATRAGIHTLVFIGPRFRGAYAPHPSELMARDWVARWTAEEGGTFRALDEESEPAFLDPELFADPGHLNARGAERLSQLLALELARVAARHAAR
jgi:hypothetical protein